MTTFLEQKVRQEMGRVLFAARVFHSSQKYYEHAPLTTTATIRLLIPSSNVPSQLGTCRTVPSPFLKKRQGVQGSWKLTWTAMLPVMNIVT